MTVRFWKDGEKFTDRELDSYWNGREEEQDRIIQLLQSLMQTRPEDWEDSYRGYSFERLIALIKGEK